MIEATTLYEIGGKGFVILVAAALTSLLLRRASASWRHALWLVAIVGLVALPVATIRAPKFNISVPEQSRFAPLAHVEGAPEASILPATPDESSTSAPAQPMDWSPIVVGLYGSGVCLLLARFALGLIGALRLARTARVIEVAFPVTRRVRLLESDCLQVPATAGLFRPVVFFPTSAQSWTDERTRMVLAHELAHVQRNDWVWGLFAQAACAIHWFNPLVWIAAHQLRKQSELACDDLVLSQGFNADQYATELLNIAKSARPQLASVLGMAHKPEVEDRLKSIVDVRRRRSAIRKRLLYVGIGLSIGVCVFVGAIKPVLAQQHQSASQSPQPTPMAAVPPSTEPGWHGPLKVTVIDGRGRPIPGAHVAFEIMNDYMLGTIAPPDGTTNKKGVYIATKASFYEDEQRLFSDTKWLSISGVIAYVPGREPLIKYVSKGQRTVKVTLGKPGLTLRAKVQHTDGSPAAGAEIFIRQFIPKNRSMSEISTPIRWRSLFTAKVNPDGYASFRSFPSGYDVQFDTKDSRYAAIPWYTSKVVTPDGETTKPVVLVKGATLEGTILADGRPMPNIDVQATRPLGNDMRNRAKTGKSDATGHFRITGVLPGTYILQVEDFTNRGTLKTYAAKCLTDIQVNEGARITGLKLQLDRGALVTGHFRHPDGRPTNITFQVGCDRAPDPSMSPLNGVGNGDQKGFYSFRIPAGRHNLYVLSIPDPAIAPSKTVDVKNGDHIVVDFVIPKGW